jgi:Zn-dependent protease
MGWSFKIGTIAGTEIRVHMTFALLLVWIWFMHYQIGGTPAAWEGVAFIVAVFTCVVLHEFGHIAAARHFGIKTPDITLLPIGGVARLERSPSDPLQELVIAVAGPLVNVLIAAFLVVALGGVVGLEQLAEPQDPRVSFVVRLAGVNIFLVLFNIIPAFPMDGGRVLRAILAWRWPWARATRVAATIGQGFAFAMGLAGFVLQSAAHPRRNLRLPRGGGGSTRRPTAGDFGWGGRERCDDNDFRHSPALGEP